MNKSKIISIVVILILLAGDVYLGMGYFSVQKELRRTQEALNVKKTNNDILEFSKLFVQDVLKADIEIGFETRLKLENAVRDLKDEEILAQWQAFVGSKTETGAQAEVKNLLEILLNKIK